MEKIEVTKFAGGERSRKHPSEKPHESRFCSAVVRINDTERSRRRVFFLCFSCRFLIRAVDYNDGAAEAAATTRQPVFEGEGIINV